MTQSEETVQAAKAFLLKSQDGQQSAYDHLVSVLKKVLTERPDDVLNKFEAISRQIKKDAKVNDDDVLKSDEVETKAFLCSQKQKVLFSRSEEDGEMDMEVILKK
jgi:radial spoke head protein 4A